MLQGGYQGEVDDLKATVTQYEQEVAAIMAQLQLAEERSVDMSNVHTATVQQLQDTIADLRTLGRESQVTATALLAQLDESKAAIAAAARFKIQETWFHALLSVI